MTKAVLCAKPGCETPVAGGWWSEWTCDEHHTSLGDGKPNYRILVDPKYLTMPGCGFDQLDVSTE